MQGTLTGKKRSHNRQATYDGFLLLKAILQTTYMKVLSI